MKGSVGLRKPVHSIALNTGTGNITTAAWKQLSAVATPYASSGVEILNPSGSTIQIATGAPGSEVVIPYTVPPGGSPGVLALEIPKGSLVSAKAVDTNMTGGFFTMNLFG